MSFKKENTEACQVIATGPQKQILPKTEKRFVYLQQLYTENGERKEGKIQKIKGGNSQEKKV